MTAIMNKHEPKNMRAIGRNALFHGLPTATLLRLSASATALNLPRGKTLNRNGGRFPGVYVVVSGCVALNVGTAESTKVIELVGAGGYLGLAATILGVPEAVTAEALADSALLLTPRAALLECAADSPQFALHLAAALSRQVRGLIADIEAFSLRSGHERVANYLLQVAAAKGTTPRPVSLPAKKSVIASRLGLTPEYFSRVLHDLISAGAIGVNGRNITILDQAQLRTVDG